MIVPIRLIRFFIFFVLFAKVIFGEAPPIQVNIVNPLFFSCAIRSIVADSRGRIWIGSFGAGTWLINESGDLLKVVSSDGSIISRRISKIIPLNGKIWAATAGEGLIYFDDTIKQWCHVEPSPGPAMKALHALLISKSGDIFIGSVGSGAAVLSGSSWHHIIDEKIGKFDPWLNDAIETEEGIWFAGSEGLWLWCEGKVKRRIVPRGSEWINPSVNVILASGSTLYIGTIQEGVVRIDPDGKQVRIKGTINDIQAMVFWRNALWAVGPNDLWKIELVDLENQKAEKILIKDAKNGSLKSLGVSPNDSLLVGTMDGKIFETKDGKFFSLVVRYENNNFVKVSKM